MRRLTSVAVAAAVAVLTSCSAGDAKPSRDEPTEAVVGERIEVVLSHCFIETVTFEGQEWNVRFRDQFGSGDYRLPQTWEGQGVIEEVESNRARYTDDGGTELEFLPVDHPAVTPMKDFLCD